ncbi:F-box domain-containing protein [Aaosphaeria arxii CBS 175.79]|uniref:F-box domain-containing protein n=1 Tax=Aaosphaeria arxii CBS 175.79 TaxID=1450172 RepID=A0A6A5Y146_9PLEO|nr:F-box domain-containing protein [Aaosphaeria arxii CBS 175.79]KAF2018966.1 F-box domain-containing protein [Aaosphaeria arxii CBS 175.79]
MAEEAFTKEQILQHLASRPRWLIEGVITINNKEKPVFSKLRPRNSSSIGALHCLPLELLHEILGYLDLQSLLRISLVSRHGHAIVEPLPAFRHLLSSAGHVFRTLTKTKVIGLHSVYTLNSILRSDRCVSCGFYGPFLSLPTAERCCHVCLFENRSLWMITLERARDIFVLSRKDMKTLPVMLSVPGHYHIRFETSRKRQFSLTSIRAVKALALKVHGSYDALSAAFAAKHQALAVKSVPLKTLQRYSQVQEAPLQQLSQDPITFRSTANVVIDKFCGMGTIPFPSISESGVENGIWCRGCELTSNSLWRRQDFTSRISLTVSEPDRFCRGLAYRTHSEAEFLEHAKHCYSASEVIMQKLL